MFKHSNNHISEKRADGSRKWYKTDDRGIESIWETYRREHLFRNLIRITKPLEFEKKKKEDSKNNDSSV